MPTYVSYTQRACQLPTHAVGQAQAQTVQWLCLYKADFDSQGLVADVLSLLLMVVRACDLDGAEGAALGRTEHRQVVKGCHWTDRGKELEGGSSTGWEQVLPLPELLRQRRQVGAEGPVRRPLAAWHDVTVASQASETGSKGFGQTSRPTSARPNWTIWLQLATENRNESRS